MIVLALATSGPYAEVGVHVSGERILTRPLGAGAARGRGLLPAVQELLVEAELQPSDLDAVAVDVGPGSFTGVRVGVTTGKTLAFALGIPVAGVSSLAALARAAPADAVVMPVRDAGRGGLYYARLGRREDDARALLEGPGREDAEALARRVGGDTVVADEEAPPLPGTGWPGPVFRARAGARAVLAEARDRLRGGRTEPPHALAPVYLQASAPERRLAGERE
ncbi:MAG: tRNA (adenosine(37)-N6)-threonylcarbamoyltransferase complex dimerization subunit type 1 TsaB [Planctomycetota bacterium]|jgi:tRNA threonylcarbamoyl adenosine modification protein YeaZ